MTVLLACGLLALVLTFTVTAMATDALRWAYSERVAGIRMVYLLLMLLAVMTVLWDFLRPLTALICSEPMLFAGTLLFAADGTDARDGGADEDGGRAHGKERDPYHASAREDREDQYAEEHQPREYPAEKAALAVQTGAYVAADQSARKERDDGKGRCDTVGILYCEAERREQYEKQEPGREPRERTDTDGDRELTPLFFTMGSFSNRSRGMGGAV